MTNTLDMRYSKARQNCAWFHLEDWGVLDVTGPDARDFLQRLGTADLRPLSPAQGSQTLFLKGDGRLIADAVVVCVSADSFRVITPPSCSIALGEQLDRFHFSEKLTISSIGEDIVVGMITGPRRTDVASKLKDGNENTIAAPVTLAPSGERLIVAISKQEFLNVRGNLYEMVEHLGGVIGGADLFHALRIEDGIPQFGLDTNEKTIPLEAGQKPAISFTKGCFPGQEIVARINNLGHPANVLVGLTLPETTAELAGQVLSIDGKEVGRITSTTWSPALRGMLGLGFVKWNQREPGVQLTINNDNTLTATVITVPLAGLSS